MTSALAYNEWHEIEKKYNADNKLYNFLLFTEFKLYIVYKLNNILKNTIEIKKSRLVVGTNL